MPTVPFVPHVRPKARTNAMPAGSKWLQASNAMMTAEASEKGNDELMQQLAALRNTGLGQTPDRG